MYKTDMSYFKEKNVTICVMKQIYNAHVNPQTSTFTISRPLHSPATLFSYLVITVIVT